MDDMTGDRLLAIKDVGRRGNECWTQSEPWGS
jgi:hypothetical protein